MLGTEQPLDRPEHHNNFGFLRLLFATMVIVSHSPEIIDGNRSREPLTNLIGHLTFGEIAVDGFFLISGYLILQSYLRSKTTISYLIKRVRRIYPGYLAAYCFCIFVLGPFVGMEIQFRDFERVGLNAILLLGISDLGFKGLPFPNMNGSLWTILVEFRCYLFVICFGLLGLYRRVFILAAITCLLVAAAGAEFHPNIPTYLHWITGSPYNLFRLFGMFCVGCMFYLFNRIMPYSWQLAAVAAAALVFLMQINPLEEPAIAIFGGYLIFWVAMHVNSKTLQRINGSDDISYGVYLYGWPVQSSLVYFLSIGNPWLLTALSIPIAYAFGYASWHLIERRFVVPRPTYGGCGDRKRLLQQNIVGVEVPALRSRIVSRVRKKIAEVARPISVGTVVRMALRCMNRVCRTIQVGALKSIGVRRCDQAKALKNKAALKLGSRSGSPRGRD